MPKISALTLGTTIDGANDLFAFVDVSDTSQAPTGTTKKAVFNSIPTQNIYNTSSSLTAPRVVTMAGNLLEFREGTALMAIDAANFGVALGNNAVNASAILDISSSSKGILIPRMTTTERNAITVGASQDSLLIYNETTNQYEYYEHATTSWTSMGGDTLYTANGTLGSTRTVSQGSNTLTFEQTEGATGFRWRSQTNSKDYAIMNTTANGSGLIIEGDDDTAVGTRQDQAILELISTTKGIYIPRMLTAQRDAITVGASQNSLLIFNTTTNQYEWYNHGTGWVALGGAGGGGIYGGSGSLIGETTVTMGGNKIIWSGGVNEFGDNVFTSGTDKGFYLDSDSVTTHNGRFFSESGQAKLEMEAWTAGGLTGQIALNTSGNSPWITWSTTSGTTATTEMFIGSFVNTDNSGGYGLRTENKTFALNTGGGGGTSAFRVLTGNGNVGINVLSPSARLHVVGGVGESPLQVDTSGISNALLVNSTGKVIVNNSGNTRNLSVNGDAIVDSTSTSNDIFEIASPSTIQLDLYKKANSGNNGISFEAQNSVNARVQYATWLQTIESNTSGSETAGMLLQMRSNGSISSSGQFKFLAGGWLSFPVSISGGIYRPVAGVNSGIAWRWALNNSVGALHNYGQITTQIIDDTDASEDARMRFYVTTGGSSFSSTNSDMMLTGTGLAVGNNLTPTASIHASASSTGKASLRLPHGTAPTSPNDGDMWTTTAGLFVRINGVTVGPLS